MASIEKEWQSVGARRVRRVKRQGRAGQSESRGKTAHYITTACAMLRAENFSG